MRQKNAERLTCYQSQIMERFLDEKAMKKFHDDYKNARKVFVSTFVPTKEDYEVARRAREIGVTATAKEYKKHSWTVAAIVRRVAVYEWRKRTEK
jgi:hypothetical protein